MLRGSSLTIRGQQQFDNSLLSADDSETTQAVTEIVDSGIMQVTKGARDDDDDNEEEEEGDETENE